MSEVHVRDLDYGGVEIEASLSPRDVDRMSRRQLDDWWAGIRLLFRAMAADPLECPGCGQPTDGRWCGDCVIPDSDAPDGDDDR